MSDIVGYNGIQLERVLWTRDCLFVAMLMGIHLDDMR